MNSSATFSQLTMTRRAGSAQMMDIERRYTNALLQVDRWAITGGNLRFTKDNTELVFTKAPVSAVAIRDLLGQWKLVSMRYGFDQQLFDRAPNAPTMTLQTASFSQTDLRVTGRGTINTYSSTAKADPSGTISLSAIAATKMGGSAQDMQAEQRFFEVLAGANRWSITRLGLRLWSARGELNFSR
jgi:heat shock protein HslJ